MELNKISTYLGFAIKSGICTRGIDAVLDNISKGYADVVLVSNELSENGLKTIMNACENRNTTYTIIDSGIFDRLLKSNTKILSIRKSELSKQIKKIILSGENK